MGVKNAQMAQKDACTNALPVRGACVRAVCASNRALVRLVQTGGFGGGEGKLGWQRAPERFASRKDCP
jgi:hypothetical protein